MVKNSTSSQIIDNSKNKADYNNGAERLDAEFNKVQKIIENKQIQAPQKSVDFVLNFSKAYKTEKLKNGEYTDMIIN
jgi:hypothetical protein